MSYGALPDFIELDRRVIYELPILSGCDAPGISLDPNLANGFIANPSNSTSDAFFGAKMKPTIETDLVNVKDQQ